MVDVIKRDGRRQKFSKAKLEKAVEKASKEAGVPSTKRAVLKKEVAQAVSMAFARRARIKSSEIRKKALAKLLSMSKKTAAAWKRYDAKRKKSAAKRKSRLPAKKTARRAPARRRKTVRRNAPQRRTAHTKRTVRRKAPRRKTATRRR